MVDGGKRENELLIYMMHNVARLLSDTSHGTSVVVLCPSSFCVLYKLLGLFFPMWQPRFGTNCSFFELRDVDELGKHAESKDHITAFDIGSSAFHFVFALCDLRAKDDLIISNFKEVSVELIW